MRLLVLLSLITFLFPKEVVAVLDLDAKGLSKEEAEILSGRLTSELIALKKYEIVERTQMFKVLDEQKFQHSGCTDSECAVEIGQLVGAEYLMIGKIIGFPGLYQIDIKIVNVEDGKVKDKVTNAVVSSADYSELGILLISVTFLTLLIPIIAVWIVQQSKFKTNE